MLVKTDNLSMGDIIMKKSSSDEGIMHLVHTLQFMMAAFQPPWCEQYTCSS